MTLIVVAQNGRSNRPSRAEVEHEYLSVPAGDSGMATVGGEGDVCSSLLQVALVEDQCLTRGP